MDAIYVVTGGTLVHVSPHFSLCAPAYGATGQELHRQLSSAAMNGGCTCQTHLVRTKMAGPCTEETTRHLRALGVADPIETNQDLRSLVEILVGRPETCCIVMAAAICDFEPVELSAHGEREAIETTTFGKDQPRLHGIRSASMSLRPSEKLIDLVKRARPDICLATFKTTAGVSEDALFTQAMQNLRRSESDLVFANDVQKRLNIVVTKSGERLRGPDRPATIELFCQELMRLITSRHRRLCRPGTTERT